MQYWYTNSGHRKDLHSVDGASHTVHVLPNCHLLLMQLMHPMNMMQENVGVLDDIFFSFSPLAVSLAPSAGNWHSHASGGGSGGGMIDYDLPVHTPQSYTHSTAHYSHTAHSRWEERGASASYELKPCRDPTDPLDKVLPFDWPQGEEASAAPPLGLFLLQLH